MKLNQGYLPVDLHLHSTASDGALPPGRVIDLAADAGLAAAALTDHDTMDGVAEALDAGKRRGIEVLPGVELSASLDDREVHLLGYDPLYPEKIKTVLEELRRERYRRTEQMAFLLRGLGFHLTGAEVNEEAGRAAPGRLHLARLMVKRGWVPHISAAFSLYLGQGGPAYVPRNTLDASRAISLLHEAGAIPVWAHPGADGKVILPRLVDMGISGLEVIHPDHAPESIRFYRHQAQRWDLLITGGSDFHGDSGYRAGRPGAFTVPYRCLTAIKEAPRGL